MISSLLSRFEFSNRRALLLSAHKAAVYQWQRGRLGKAYLFDVTEDGRQHFVRYLSETAPAPFYLLLDVFEEEFRSETIPHVFGSDRAALIKRRQERLFSGTPYCHYELQGREGHGRRDDRILFSAVTNAGLISPWVELLHRHKIPLAGIHSIPLFGGAILKLIPAASANSLVVSLQSVSGLRQSFYQNTHLKFSRLVRMPRYGTAPYAPYIAAEAEKIRRYINSLRLTGENAALDVYFLAAGELLEELKQAHTETEAVHYHAVDLHALADPSYSAKARSTPFSDQFFVHNLLQQAPANRYARPADTRYFAMRRLRHIMLATALVVTVGSAIWSGLNLLSGLSYQQSSRSAQDKARFYQARDKIARERLPQTPVEPADLRRAVQLAAALREYKTTPLETVSLISKGLARFPEIILSDMQWAWSVNPNVPLSPGGNTAGVQAAATHGDAAPDETDYRLYQVSMVTAYVEPFDGDFRAAIALINEFAASLRGDESAYAVRILSLPLDISPASSLHGDVGATTESASFTMRIVVGINHAAQ